MNLSLIRCAVLTCVCFTSISAVCANAAPTMQRAPIALPSPTSSPKRIVGAIHIKTSSGALIEFPIVTLSSFPEGDPSRPIIVGSVYNEPQPSARIVVTVTKVVDSASRQLRELASSGVPPQQVAIDVYQAGSSSAIVQRIQFQPGSLVWEYEPQKPDGTIQLEQVTFRGKRLPN